jgi:hypothetical protein
MEDVKVSNVERSGQDAEKRDLPLLSLLMVAMHGSRQWNCHGKADGKKKVIRKERRFTE